MLRCFASTARNGPGGYELVSTVAVARRRIERVVRSANRTLSPNGPRMPAHEAPSASRVGPSTSPYVGNLRSARFDSASAGAGPYSAVGSIDEPSCTPSAGAEAPRPIIRLIQPLRLQ